MRFSKKTAVMALAVTMLTLGSTSAMAQRNPGGDGDGGGGGGGGGGGDGGGRGKVTVCHRTSSERNPWVKIRVSENALDAHERHGDTFPDADGDCPGPDIPDQDGNGDGGGNGGDHDNGDHGDHDNGDDGDHDNGDDGDHEADSCSVRQENTSENSTGDTAQSGLININNIALQGLNLDILGNLLCQANFLNDIVGAVLGTATGDSDGGDHGDDHHERFGGAVRRGTGGLLGGLLGDDSALSALGLLF